MPKSLPAFIIRKESFDDRWLHVIYNKQGEPLAECNTHEQAIEKLAELQQAKAARKAEKWSRYGATFALFRSIRDEVSKQLAPSIHAESLLYS